MISDVDLQLNAYVLCTFLSTFFIDKLMFPSFVIQVMQRRLAANNKILQHQQQLQRTLYPLAVKVRCKQRYLSLGSECTHAPNRPCL